MPPNLGGATGPSPRGRRKEAAGPPEHGGAKFRSAQPKGQDGSNELSWRCLAPPFWLGGQGLLQGAWKEFDFKTRSEEHTSELQSRLHLVCRLLLEKKKKRTWREVLPATTPSSQPRNDA